MGGKIIDFSEATTRNLKILSDTYSELMARKPGDYRSLKEYTGIRVPDSPDTKEFIDQWDRSVEDDISEVKGYTAVWVDKRVRLWVAESKVPNMLEIFTDEDAVVNDWMLKVMRRLGGNRYGILCNGFDVESGKHTVSTPSYRRAVAMSKGLRFRHMEHYERYVKEFEKQLGRKDISMLQMSADHYELYWHSPPPYELVITLAEGFGAKILLTNDHYCYVPQHPAYWSLMKIVHRNVYPEAVARSIISPHVRIERLHYELFRHIPEENRWKRVRDESVTDFDSTLANQGDYKTWTLAGLIYSLKETKEPMPELFNIFNDPDHRECFKHNLLSATAVQTTKGRHLLLYLYRPMKEFILL